MKSKEEGSIKELIKDKDSRNNLLLSLVIWSVSCFNFYLLTFYLKYFPGNIFQNSLSFAVADIIAYAFAGTILKKTNTNKTLISSYITSALGGILYLCLYS